ncbi:unnamed protein product [Alopecurus aequalis]
MSLIIAIFAVLALSFTPAPGAAVTADAVSARRPLRGNDTMVSARGKFEVGFFSPAGSSGRFYLGIWYSNISVQTIIWVGNRNNPLSDFASAELRVSADDGNLELVGLASASSSAPAVVWSSNLSSTSTLSPSLPGSNTADPAPGIFYDTVDPKGSSEFFYLWNRSRTYWRSGVWTGRVFARLPEATSNVLFNQTYVETPAYRRVTSVLYDNATITRMVLDLTGQTKQFIWVPASQSWQFFWAAPTVQCDVHQSGLRDLRSSQGRGKKRGRRLWLVLGIALAGVAALGASLFLAWRILLARGRSMSVEKGSSLTVYSYGDLRAATKNFSDKLGGGGFGSDGNGGGEVEEAAAALSTFFPVWAAGKVVEGGVGAVADPRRGDVREEELERACRVACWCIQDEEAHRPTMAQVVQALEGVVDVHAPPVPRGLQHLATLT